MMGTVLESFEKKKKKERKRKKRRKERKNFVRCPRRGIGGLSERESRNQGEDNSMFMVIQAHHEQNFLQSSRYAIHAYHYLRISSFPTVPSGRIIGPCHLEKSSTFPLPPPPPPPPCCPSRRSQKERTEKEEREEKSREKDDNVRCTQEERAFLD